MPLDLGEEWRVKLDDALIQSLEEWLSPENVRIEYQQAVRPSFGE